MWWIVYYWDHDPVLRSNFVNQHKFDSLSSALEFAQLHNARVLNTLTNDCYYLDDGDVLVWTPDADDWQYLCSFQSILENEE